MCEACTVASDENTSRLTPPLVLMRAAAFGLPRALAFDRGPQKCNRSFEIFYYNNSNFEHSSPACPLWLRQNAHAPSRQPPVEGEIRSFPLFHHPIFPVLNPNDINIPI